MDERKTILKKTNSENEDVSLYDKYFDLLLRRNRSRLWITLFTILLFVGIVIGVVYALIAETEMSASWREILLLLLGAFIGSYGRVMDYWFGSDEKDVELMRQASGGVDSDYGDKNYYTDPPDGNSTSLPNQTYIVNCGSEKSDDLKFKSDLNETERP